MIAVRETTKWDVEYKQPNHVYLMEGDKIYAYIKWGEGDAEWFKNPIRIDKRGRKFEELKANPFEVKEEQPSFIVRVKGSKGNTYDVDTDAKTCTCPGFTFRGACKHISELVK